MQKEKRVFSFHFHVEPVPLRQIPRVCDRYVGNTEQSDDLTLLVISYKLAAVE